MAVLVEVSPAAWRGRLGLMEVGMAFALGEVNRPPTVPPLSRHPARHTQTRREASMRGGGEGEERGRLGPWLE